MLGLDRAAIPEEHRDPDFDPEEADGPEEEPVDLMPDGLLAERGWMKTWLGKHPSCACALILSSPDRFA